MPVIHAVLTSYGSGGTIDALDPLSKNIGGAVRSLFMELVKQLPKYGHTVRAFSTFKESIESNGVQYLPLDQLDSHGIPDVIWAQYDTRPLAGRRGSLRIGSHHTYYIDAPFADIDINTSPSQAAMEIVKQKYAPNSEWRVLPNAVDNMPDRAPVRGRVIHHASPDRGLHILAHAWPQIKSKVPEATLHIVGCAQEWIKQTQNENGERARRARMVKEGLELATAAGDVVSMSYITRSELLTELSQASVFAFPCSVMSPSETFSVCVMECCKMGIPVVLSPSDVLGSIYENHVLMTPAPVENNIDEFVDGVVQILTDNALADRYSKLGKQLAAPYTHENAGKILNDIIVSKLEAE